MASRKWIVAIDWIDNGTEDTDEIVVFARTAAEARSIACDRWHTTIGAKWPHCRLCKAWILNRWHERQSA